MVKSQMLTGAEFDYCRTCRKELAEMIQPELEPTRTYSPQDLWSRALLDTPVSDGNVYADELTIDDGDYRD